MKHGLRILLPFLFLSPLPAWPAGEEVASGGELPRVLHFSKTEYQAQNQNWALARAPNGFLYAANSAGLLEFDGARWRLYTLPDRQIVRAVACDAEGRIFCGGFGEFGYWERQPDGCLAYHSLSSDLDYQRTGREEIWHILPLGDRVLFQSFSIFYEYDYRRIRPVIPPGNIMFLQDIGGRIIVPVIDQGLYEWQSGDRFHFLPGTEELADRRVKALLPFGADILVGTEQGGLLLYDGRRLSPWANEAGAALRKHRINRVVSLPANQLAVGTISNGLYVLDDHGRLLYHLNQANGLQNNTVLSLEVDNTGDLWLGLDKGIDLATLSDPLIYYHDRTGRTGTVYSAVLHDQRLYLGTNQGLYVRPWPGLPGHDFRLLEGTQGQVWDLTVFDRQLFCGHNEGTFLIRDEQAERISEVTGGWSMRPVPGRPGKLVQGTYTGLILLEKTAAGDWRFARRIGGMLEPLKNIAFDDQGFLWAVNPYRGLYRLRLNPALDSIAEIRSFTRTDGLTGEYRLGLTGLDGRIVVRADTTSLVWDETIRRLIPLTTFRGATLPPGALTLAGTGEEWFCLLPDRVVWMQGNKPLKAFALRLVPENERIIALNASLYLFCLDDGYALLDRWAPRSVPAIPAPLIREVAVLRTADSAGNGRFLPLTRAAPLPARQNHLRFAFALPFFSRPVLYRYRLTGFQEQWSDWSAAGTREYTNLPPGNYRFEVQTNLSDRHASFSFSIAPPWYRTWWAQLLYLLLMTGVGLSLLRWHHYRLDRQRRRLEIARERQLQQQRIRARNQQLQTDVINKSKELANSTFNLVRKNEILQQLKEAITGLKTELGDRLPDRSYKKLVRFIDRHLTDEQDWAVFESNFNQVHEAFLQRLKQEFPDLTPGDLRLAAYLRMNLSSKEIAPLLNISIRGVENKRYRLRRKLNLPAEGNLTDFMINY